MATDFGLDGFPATSELQQPEKQTAYAQQFDWLCRSWAIAGIFHFLTFHDWRWQGLSGLILICLAMAVLLRPKPVLFALFLAVDIFAVGSHMGPVPNHILFSLVMNIVMLGVNTFGWTYATRREKPPGDMPYVVLEAPSGEIWTHGNPSDTERVEGRAEEFCQV